ncbi:MAG: hypothetical protein V1882_01945 [Candidatus Omnitrophota bacterium]
MGITDWFVEFQTKIFAKSCASAMLMSFLGMKKHYKEQAPTFAWLACKALETRPNWEQITPTVFQYRLSTDGDVISIADDMSLADVVRMVVGEELDYNLRSLDATRRLTLIKLGVNEANKALGGK